MSEIESKPKWLVALNKEIEEGQAQFQNLRIKKFSETVQAYAQDIGCDGNGNIGSHKIPSHVHFYLTNPETGEDQVLALYAIQMDMLMGCGCPDGLTFKLVATDETI